MKALFSLLPLAALVFAPALLAQTTYTYTSVDYPGAGYTLLNGINSAGTIVGVYTTTVAGNHSFLRSADGSFQPLLPGTISNAAGISDSGVIVGSVDNSGFILSRSFTPVKVSNYPTYLNGISTSSSIVGDFAVENNHGSLTNHGFRTISGKLVQLPYYNDKPVQALGINTAGTIVGFSTATAESDSGFILPSGGTYQILNYADAIGTIFTAINDAGVLAGSQESPPSSYAQGFTYNGTVFSDVIYPGSSGTYPQGINNSGVVVGYYIDARFLTHGFIATPVP